MPGRAASSWHIPPVVLERLHLALTVVWFKMMPLAIATGWINSVKFVSVISIYANFVGHFSSWQAARAERKVDGDT